MNKFAPAIAIVVLCAMAFLIFTGDDHRSADINTSLASTGNLAAATIENGSAEDALVIEREQASTNDQLGMDKPQGLEHVSGEPAFITFTVADIDGVLLPECLVSPEKRKRARTRGPFNILALPNINRDSYKLSSNASILLAVSSGREAYFSVHHPQWQEHIFTCQTPASGEVLDLGEITLTPAAIISGIVTNQQGQAINSASVKAIRMIKPYSIETVIAAVTTDEQGSFTISGLKADEYIILTQAPSYTDTRVAVSIKSIPESKTVAIQLEDGATISGRVVGTNGLPIANVEIVQVLELGQPQFASPQTDVKGSIIATTDSNGNYSARIGITNGVANIGARHSDYIDAKVTISDNYSAADITMQSSLHLYGSFSDTSNLDIQAATVYLNANLDNAKVTVLDIDGNFKFDGIAAGTYTLSASTNLGKIEIPNITIQASIDDYLLELPLAPRLNLQVIDIDGMPIDNAYLMFTTPRRKNSMPSVSYYVVAFTSSNGLSVIGGMPHGEYSLRITHPDYAKTVMQINVWQENEDIEIVLRPAATLTVNLQSSAQQAVSRIRVMLIQDGKDAKDAKVANTNGFGAANFSELNAGEYQLAFDSNDTESRMARWTFDENGKQLEEAYGQLGRTSVQLAAGEHQIVDWQINDLCDLTVQVRKDGRPAVGAIVNIERISDSQRGSMRFNSSSQEGDVRTNSQGAAVLINKLAGEYILNVKDNNNSFATEQRITLYQGVNNVDVNIVINSISGTLLDSSGNPAANHELSLIKTINDDGSPDRSTTVSVSFGNQRKTVFLGEGIVTAMSESNGDFSFEGVPNGKWLIIARHPKNIAAESEVFTLDSGTSLDIGIIKFRHGGSISGINARHAHDGNSEFNSSSGNNFIVLTAVDENGFVVSNKSTYSAAGQGKFSLKQLDEGNYIIRCGDFVSETIHLSSGEELNFDIPAEK